MLKSLHASHKISKEKITTRPQARARKQKGRRILKRRYQESEKKILLKKTMIAAVKAADKAAKKHVIHKNKAARIKSSLSKLLQTKTETKKVSPRKKTATKKRSKIRENK